MGSHLDQRDEYVRILHRPDPASTPPMAAAAGRSLNYGSVLQNTIYTTVEGPSGILYAADSSIHDLFQSDRLTSIIDGGTGAVIMSTDGGADWTMMHNFNLPVDDIILDPNIANRAYALVVNSTKGGIFVTNDLSDGALRPPDSSPVRRGTAGHPWDMQILKNGTLLVTYSGTLILNRSRRPPAYSCPPTPAAVGPTSPTPTWLIIPRTCLSRRGFLAKDLVRHRR